jgi:hypothetical protein
LTKTICPICGRELDVRSAFTPIVVEEGYILGRADENIPGYTPIYAKVFDTIEEAEQTADELNERHGLTKKEAYEIIASTMRQLTKKKEEVE